MKITLITLTFFCSIVMHAQKEVYVEKADVYKNLALSYSLSTSKDIAKVDIENLITAFKSDKVISEDEKMVLKTIYESNGHYTLTCAEAKKFITYNKKIGAQAKPCLLGYCKSNNIAIELPTTAKKSTTSSKKIIKKK